MTYEKAIKHLRVGDIYTDSWEEAVLMAIEALEKQIVEKPIEDGYYNIPRVCPRCGEYIHTCFNYCPYCGQAIDMK